MPPVLERQEPQRSPACPPSLPLSPSHFGGKHGRDVKTDIPRNNHSASSIVPPRSFLACRYQQTIHDFWDPRQSACENGQDHS
jgi:hypothetical protein